MKYLRQSNLQQQQLADTQRDGIFPRALAGSGSERCRPGSLRLCGFSHNMATVFIRNMVVSAHETSAKSELLHEETSHTLHTPAGSPFVLWSPPPRTGYKSQHSQASLLSNLLLLRAQPAQAFKTRHVIKRRRKDGSPSEEAWK